MPRARRDLRLREQALQISLDPREFVGVWRAGLPDRDLLDPTRSREYFGRWHNPTTGALYFTAELSTALRELHAHLNPPFPEVVQTVEATVRLRAMRYIKNSAKGRLRSGR